MIRNKKILILINNLNFFISHRLLTAKASLAKGYKVVVGYGELGGANIELLEQNGFTVKYIPMDRGGMNFFKELKTLFYIWKFFKNEKPDIVHLVTIKPYLYGGIISRLLGVTGLVSAVSGLGTLFINNDLKFRFLRVLLFPFFKLAFNHNNQKVILQNRDDLKMLVDWGVLNYSNSILIKGSGVEIDKFTNLDEPAGLPTVCFASRLIRDKGVYEFVSAASMLGKRGVKARFLLAGDLDTNNLTGLNIEELKKLKNESNIEVLGYQKNIPILYSGSHIICLPSYREGLPKSLIEAAAASRAIVTTDVPGCRDAIIPNKTGLLVPVKDSIKLADALQWLIENPKERVQMGKAGRIFAEKEFKIEKISQNHLDIYKKLLN